MSTSHHGDGASDPRIPGPDLERLMQRFNDQISKTARREYPHGRIRADDDGVLVYAVAADHEHGTVIVNFGKPVTWIGMEPKDAIALAESLIANARKIAKEPLIVNV